MKKPKVIELLRNFVNSEDSLYPLLGISAKDLIDYIDYQDNIINELEKDIELELMKTREPSEYNKGLHNAFGYIKGKLQELKDAE